MRLPACPTLNCAHNGYRTRTGHCTRCPQRDVKFSQMWLPHKDTDNQQRSFWESVWPWTARDKD